MAQQPQQPNENVFLDIKPSTQRVTQNIHSLSQKTNTASKIILDTANA